MDVLVSPSPSVGVGDGGEGGGEQAVASIFSDEKTLLVSQEWNESQGTQTVLIFVHQIFLTQGDVCQCFSAKMMSFLDYTERFLRIRFLNFSPAILA